MDNSFAKIHPELITEWSDKNDIMPDMISFGSNKLFWWQGKCGHEWQASPKSRSSGENCPICAGKKVVQGINDLETLKPELAKEWSPKNTLKPNEVTTGSNKKVLWIDSLAEVVEQFGTNDLGYRDVLTQTIKDSAASLMKKEAARETR